MWQWNNSPFHRGIRGLRLGRTWGTWRRLRCQVLPWQLGHRGARAPAMSTVARCVWWTPSWKLGHFSGRWLGRPCSPRGLSPPPQSRQFWNMIQSLTTHLEKVILLWRYIWNWGVADVLFKEQKVCKKQASKFYQKLLGYKCWNLCLFVPKCYKNFKVEYEKIDAVHRRKTLEGPKDFWGSVTLRLVQKSNRLCLAEASKNTKPLPVRFVTSYTSYYIIRKKSNRLRL